MCLFFAVSVQSTDFYDVVYLEADQSFMNFIFSCIR